MAGRIICFFHPNAAIEPHGRHAPPGGVQAPPMFEPDLNDAVLLRALLPVATWQSAICDSVRDSTQGVASTCPCRRRAASRIWGKPIMRQFCTRPEIWGGTGPQGTSSM